MAKPNVIQVSTAVQDAVDATKVALAGPVMSSANRLMAILPRIVESAVEQGHGALKALRESAAKYAVATGDAGRSTVEPLYAMLTDVVTCLTARKAGAKQVKNSEIDRMLIEAGVKEPRAGYVKNADGTKSPAIGSKSGASRFIALATFETAGLWSKKQAAALGFIAQHGIAFVKGGETFKSPMSAILAGVPFSSVHQVWAKAVRDYNTAVTPTTQPTKAERITKSAVALTLPERTAMIAALTATLPVTK